MKKQTLFCLAAFASIFMVSCDKDPETVDPTVENLVLTTDVDGNKLAVSAEAENAFSYSWDFGNGLTANGESAETEYKMHGKYWVKCTATGQTSKLTDSVEVTIDFGDPDIYNNVAKLLCGYDEETGESSAVWYWAANTDMVLSGGAKTYAYQHDSAMYSIFDPIDQSWWNESAPSLAESFNDAYSFKLNQSFDYVCDYKEDGFNCNWAYAFHRYSMDVGQYGDVALSTAPTAGSWEIEIYDFADYSTYEGIVDAPKTMVNGIAEDKAYYLNIKNGAYLFQENAEAKYQILSITSDSVLVRWETGLPEDFNTDAGWEWPDWLSPGEGEWQYSYLVKEESTPVE